MRAGGSRTKTRSRAARDVSTSSTALSTRTPKISGGTDNTAETSSTLTTSVKLPVLLSASQGLHVTCVHVHHTVHVLSRLPRWRPRWALISIPRAPCERIYMCGVDIADTTRPDSLDLLRVASSQARKSHTHAYLREPKVAFEPKATLVLKLAHVHPSCPGHVSKARARKPSASSVAPHIYVSFT